MNRKERRRQRKGPGAGVPVDTVFERAAALHRAGRADEALALYKRVLKAQPRHSLALSHGGVAAMQAGRAREAEAMLRDAVRVDPLDADAHGNLGHVLKMTGDVDGAVAAYRRAIGIEPGHAAAHNGLGIALESRGDHEGAIAAYRHALAIRPDDARALGNLAALLEEINHIDEARETVAAGLRAVPDDPFINVIAAKLDRREGRYEDARHRLSGLLAARPGGDVETGIRFELGTIHDRLGDAERAFSHFREANRLQRGALPAAKIGDNAYVREIDALRTLIADSENGSWSPSPPGDGVPPVFLVGFPRSGTTLLDQILDSHPLLDTMEEKPAVEAMKNRLAGFTGGYPDALRDLAPARAAELRDAYFSVADGFVDRPAGSRLVDKLPLNIANAALIWRAFPDAQFILAVRHPCDVCLSCFMQRFTINDAMANFFSIEETALLYARVMELWRSLCRVLPIDHHVIRYEDLVDDFEAETQRLLGFLNVGWNDAVRAFSDHARKRERIRTPSYHQVAEPIYRRARYRWRRYERHLAPVMEILGPHIEEFGYAAGGDAP